MFTKNKYYKIYMALIEDRGLRKPRGDFYESHHIIPRSLGGNNDSTNLVNLTPREHFFAHLLLSKFTSGEGQIKMTHALRMMSNFTKSKKLINSHQYELSKSIIYKILQSAGKDYQAEKSLQDSILTEYTDINKVFDRGTCKCCGIRPRAINYIKNEKTFYRSKCEVCLVGNNEFKVPLWKKDGYIKQKICEFCDFTALFTEQLTVVTENRKYKTICLNCQVEYKLAGKKLTLKPLADF